MFNDMDARIDDRTKKMSAINHELGAEDVITGY